MFDTCDLCHVPPRQPPPSCVVQRMSYCTVCVVSIDQSDDTVLYQLCQLLYTALMQTCDTEEAVEQHITLMLTLIPSPDGACSCFLRGEGRLGIAPWLPQASLPCPPPPAAGPCHGRGWLRSSSPPWPPPSPSPCQPRGPTTSFSSPSTFSSSSPG